jgi:hypothetical protein
MGTFNFSYSTSQTISPLAERPLNWDSLGSFLILLKPPPLIFSPVPRCFWGP